MKQLPCLLPASAHGTRYTNSVKKVSRNNCLQRTGRLMTPNLLLLGALRIKPRKARELEHWKQD